MLSDASPTRTNFPNDSFNSASGSKVRGETAISPELLLEQVRSASGWLFAGPEPEGASFRYIRVLRGAEGRELNALGYYELCLCAHWATAGSFVPTDVDNAIRWKLWQNSQPGLVEEQAKNPIQCENSAT